MRAEYKDRNVRNDVWPDVAMDDIPENVERKEKVCVCKWRREGEGQI